MKLLYLLKEDFKHVAWLLLFNASLVAAITFPFTELVDGLIDGRTGFSRLERVGPFILMLYIFVTGILTQRLLGKDSLCDVDAFWLSKPFDGLQLLASKGIVLLVVFFAIPWMFVWTVATNSGVGAPWAALIWHGYWTLWFAPVLVFFAVHTKGLSTMLVGSTAFAAVMIIGHQFFSTFYFFGGRPQMGGFFHLIAYLVYLVSVSTAIVLPFLNRRVWLARRIAGIGVLITIAIPLLGFQGYLGESNRIVENEAIARSLVVEEPVFRLNFDVGSRKHLNIEKRNLEIEAVPENFLFNVTGARALFRAPGESDVHWGNSQRRRIPGVSPQGGVLAELLSRLNDWDLESLYSMRKTSIDIEDNFQLRGPGVLEDRDGQWKLNVVLDRIAVENVTVVPFEDGREIVYGGIRTVLRQTGAATDYLTYMIVEYSYEDFASDPPIQFHRSVLKERLNRYYFLKGKSGRLWKPRMELSRIRHLAQFGLQKRFGNLDAIQPLTDGVDDEELELVIIDVRDLGYLSLEVDARTSL